MKHAGTLVLSLIFLSTAEGAPGPGSDADPLGNAWEAWKNGDIEQARGRAQTAIDYDPACAEALHILFLTAAGSGRYAEAIEHYQKIPATYPRRGEADRQAIRAYEHLDRYAEAAALATEHKTDEAWYRRRKENPTTSSLSVLATLPFAPYDLGKLLPGQKGDLSDYFPAFEIELEGKRVTAWFDTGAPFICMSPKNAEELGLELETGDMGHLAGQIVRTSKGIAKRMKLGDAVLTNIPVVVAPSVDRIIFGTNVIERFLSTLDYPNRRLILSPRGNAKLTKEHLGMLPTRRTEVPFYLWDDHYMFARGGLGERKGLNFFVDSGLVAFYCLPDLRQAAFTAPFDALVDYGYRPEEIKRGGFLSRHALSLGPLVQDGHAFHGGGNPGDKRYEFGGVRIDGLLSHAFLKKYAWTIDFDRHVYVFSEPENPPSTEK